jgi:hypothetical protein
MERMMKIMSIRNYYLEAEKELNRRLYLVENYREINYGIQFRISKFDQSHLVRIYNSKSKGTRLDYSQIKHPIVKKDLKEIKNKLDQNHEKNYRKNIQESFELPNKIISDKIVSYLISRKAKRKSINSDSIKYLFRLSNLTFTIYNNNSMMIQGKSNNFNSLKKEILMILSSKSKTKSSLKKTEIRNQLSLFDQELNNKILRKENLKLVG